ncbi:MAG: AMP-binding protein [Alphaproteobacteria bacterium]|nr:MAG: AMP-binding protein [Alphaproteobacteria bacterium]
MLRSYLYYYLQISVSLCSLDTYILLGLFIFVFAYTVFEISQRDLKELLYKAFRLFYKTEIVGFENYEKIKDKKFIIISNHESFIDAPLIMSHFPEKLTFSVKPSQAHKWYIKPFYKLVKIIEVSSINPFGIKELIQLVKDGERLLIFPEGRITTTGSLMKMYPGAAVIAQKANAYVLPVRIENAVNSIFSCLKEKKSLFPKIRLHILPPQKLKEYKDLSPKLRRDKAKIELYKIMSNMIFETNLKKATPLFENLVTACEKYGKSHVVLEDVDRKKWTYKKLLQAVYVFSQLLPKREKRIAILLPNVIPTVVLFFALHRKSITPVFLNYSTGMQNLLASCKIAKVRTIFTSRKFIQRLNIDVSEFTGHKLVYLEDIKEKLTLSVKLRGLFAMHFSALPTQKMDDPAYILFTSGSEGMPKGVVLTHRNIQANVYQMLSRTDITLNDRLFNTMPMFHSFGITCGVMLPLLHGVKVFLFPNPLEFRLIPELLYDTGSTIVFATNSFLKGYAKFASSYDFHWIRYIFAGAEKLQDETRQLYFQKFGKIIYEGYGTTEASPVVSINTQMCSKPGSVGLLMPGIQYKLKKVEGIKKGGILQIRGPNMMHGYLGKTPLDNKFYDTGDVVEVDDDGFISIVARLKRFAKVHGEMIDLTLLERLVQSIWDNFEHAAIAKPSKSGESIHLYTTKPKAKLEDVAKVIKKEGYTLLMAPKKIHVLDALPRLGSGKIDYMALKNM